MQAGLKTTILDDLGTPFQPQVVWPRNDMWLISPLEEDERTLRGKKSRLLWGGNVLKWREH